jgi:multiple sugar transport system permease protein
MVVPHQTIQYSMFMNFRYFDIFGIIKFLSGNATVGEIGFLNDILANINIFGAEPTSKFLQSVVEDGAFNLNNSYWPLIILSLTGLGFKNGLYVFMLRQFFMGVPNELEESAYIDGSGTGRTFLQIILPLSVPMMITVFLFAFSWQWTDDFYTTLFFTTNKTVLMPDVVDIPTSLTTDYPGQNLYYSAIRNTCGLLIILPLVIMYLFCQNFLVQGIERSGLTAD